MRRKQHKKEGKHRYRERGETWNRVKGRGEKEKGARNLASAAKARLIEEGIEPNPARHPAAGAAQGGRQERGYALISDNWSHEERSEKRGSSEH